MDSYDLLLGHFRGVNAVAIGKVSRTTAVDSKNLACPPSNKYNSIEIPCAGDRYETWSAEALRRAEGPGEPDHV